MRRLRRPERRRLARRPRRSRRSLARRRRIRWPRRCRGMGRSRRRLRVAPSLRVCRAHRQRFSPQGRARVSAAATWLGCRWPRPPSWPSMPGMSGPAPRPLPLTGEAHPVSTAFRRSCAPPPPPRPARRRDRPGPMPGRPAHPGHGSEPMGQRGPCRSGERGLNSAVRLRSEPASALAGDRPRCPIAREDRPVLGAPIDPGGDVRSR